jgi:hypothetical protein
VFTSIVMIVGVLTVCFTSSRSTSKYIFVFFYIQIIFLEINSNHIENLFLRSHKYTDICRK